MILSGFKRSISTTFASRPRERKLVQGVLCDRHGGKSYPTLVVARKQEQRLDDQYIKTLDPAVVNNVVNKYLVANTTEDCFVVPYA